MVATAVAGNANSTQWAKLGMLMSLLHTQHSPHDKA